MGKKGKESLGRALIKDRFSKNRHKRHVEDNSMLHTTEVNDGYDWGRLNLQSVTAESSLQEFLSTAELADKEFAAEKLNIHYVKSSPSHVLPPTSQPDFSEPLTLPRRPKWLPGVSAEEQAEKERQAFLDWRKHLNELQEKLGAALTPYERNLELWKQLWRTLERCDLVMLLLDARNPLLFRSSDLEAYAAEQNCKCVLLLNKADLISEYQRRCWAEYFDKEGIPIVFFSAAKTSSKDHKEDDISEEPEISDTDSAYSDSEDEEKYTEKDKLQKNENLNETEQDIEIFKKQVEALDKVVTETGDKLNKIQIALNTLLENIKLGKTNEIAVNVQEKSDDSETVKVDVVKTNELSENTEIKCDETNIIKYEGSSKIQNSHKVHDREQLLATLKSYKPKLKLKNPTHLTVGMIGYPNVGKSSTVNILMQTKKVSVSAMPGHTRHLQSLVLDEDIHILDCPGLVLPAYAVAPDLLLTAVLPIDEMRVWEGAVRRLCELVSRQLMQRQYGLLLPGAPDSHLDYKELLTAHAFNRGMMTAAGQPDVSRSARILLKDAASGRLSWCVLPPGCVPEKVQQEELGDRRQPTARERRLVEGWSSKAEEIDKSFFAAGKGGAHVKGKPMVGLSGTHPTSTPEEVGKPWKKEKRHANKNKRQKLRLVYSHLDQH